MFKDVPAQFDFPAAEREVLRFWEASDIYAKSLRRREGSPTFVFYEGPPTANGLPHPGHCLTRIIKDVFPRYRTMTGHYCHRKAGWDTHGLPVETEVCKELGIHTKPEIEQFGIEKFICRCQESVFRYTREWEELTRRIGFWINLDEAYVTYRQSYVESVWWALATLFRRGLLYQSYKVVWWWPQGGTALSAGEVGQGYREVDDPSITVRFRLRVGGWENESDPEQYQQKGPLREFLAETGADPNEPISFLAWTTTPWTLPSNVALAVHPEFDYAVVRYARAGDQPEWFILAKDLIEQVFHGLKVDVEKDLSVKSVVKGRGLLNLRYEPLFPVVWRPLEDGLVGDTRSAQPGVAKPFSRSSPALPQSIYIVLPADFVSLATGTGIVHIAPAFGEDDFKLAAKYTTKFLQLVNPDGTMDDRLTDVVDGQRIGGTFCRDADPLIIKLLRDKGLLLKREQVRHDYPFCWRAEDDPLIQYARRSWFVRTTAFREAFLANNAKVNWLPEHIRDGRFGNFLADNVDWALSRERFWGTPLPIWECEKTGRQEAVASYAELLAKPGVTGTEVWEQAKKANPDLVDDLKVHKPYIDAITYESPFAAGAPSARMRRVPEVIDCWFDSGCMPFAQWGFPHQPGSLEQFQQRFPADFISEAIDQTRGWFYTLLAISTMLFGEKQDPSIAVQYPNMPPIAALRGRPLGRILIKMGKVTREQVGEALEIQKQAGRAIGQILIGLGYVTERDVQVALAAQSGREPLEPTFSQPYPHPFRNCVVLGLVAGEDGKKLSKSKRNYKEPGYIFDREGADAMRWSMLSSQTPWTGARFVEEAIATDQREFLIKLYNVYSFFVIYSNIDRWSPSDPAAQECDVSELDRWIAAEFHQTIADVRAAMDRYENYPACRRLVEFVDALSNWYVRRSRDRFWRSGMDPDKKAAYLTLWSCLTTLSELIAPFTPFFAETLYQNLARLPFPSAEESVHLRDYPQADESRIDRKLMEEMAIVREIASLGRSARMEARLKVRQPLAVVELVLADPAHRTWLENHLPLIADELNVKRAEFAADADRYVTYEIRPSFKSIGPKFGTLAPQIKQALARADAAALRRQLDDHGQLALAVGAETVVLTPDDVQVALKAKPGWTAAQGRQVVVVLSTEITDELKAEGLARDLVHLIQNARKAERLDYQARIRLRVNATGPLAEAIHTHREYICGETLCTQLAIDPSVTDSPHATEIEGAAVQFTLDVVT